MTAHDSLLSALAELRTSENLAAPRHRHAWETIFAFVRKTPPPDDDLRQETVIRIHRGVARFAGQTDAEAAAWIRRVHRHGAIDSSRAAGRDPVAKGLKSSKAGTDEHDPFEKISAPAEGQSADVLDRFRDHFFDALDDTLAKRETNASKRLLRRLEAKAAYLRLVHDLDTPAMRERLGPPGRDASDAQLYKWVERGRALLIDHARTLKIAGSPFTPEAVEIISEIASARRADAGKSRRTAKDPVSSTEPRASKGKEPKTEKSPK